MNKKLLFPVLLMGLTLPLALGNKFTGVNAEFIGDYSQQSAYTKAGSALNAQICDEGFVLLKNKDNFLPMKGGEKLSVVGKSSVDLVRGGGGSGSGRVNGETAIDLQQSLKNAGFEINPKFTDFYKSSSKSGPGRSNGNDNWKGNSQVQIGETPFSMLEKESGLLDSIEQYKDAAIMTISREGSEGCDVKAIDARDFDPCSGKLTGVTAGDVTDRHALQLSENEEALFNYICEKFDHVIILINSGNIFQCDKFENNDKVSAVIWMGNPGAVGTGAIGRILSGQVNPSGRTVDTWARNFKQDPTYQNFSDNSQTNDQIIEVTVNSKKKNTYASQDTMFAEDGAPMLSYGTDKNYKAHESPRWVNADAKVVQGGLNGVKPASYVSYEEGIYVDYRYYETRYADMAAKNKGQADEWYKGDEGVIYPFGYGLSYTTFEQKIVSSNVKGKTIKDGNTEIEVKVNVKNTGNVAGKEVVQLYWKAPYKKGGIEKANNVLCAFDKTEMLEPGEEQTLTLKVNSQDFANYDFSDANQNGFCGYELEGGTYYISLNKNAHEELGSVKFSVNKNGIKYDKDRYTGNEVKNRFTDRGFYSCLPGENDIGFEQFSRVDLSKKPTHPTVEERTVKAGSRYEEFLTHEFTLNDLEDGKGEYIPLESLKTKADIEALGWTQAASTVSKADSIQFKDLVGLDMDDPLWEQAMNQMTYTELLSFSYGGGNHNPAISRMDKPGTGDSDGPSQFKYIWWAGAPIVAATYNVELARKQGEYVGIEAHISGTYGWAGPAVNTHRSPFGGRNFEYYAADPYLMGKIAAKVVGGATDTGLYCYFKHFAVNDQEKNREGTSTFLTEQALREIYLRPFQMCVQEGKSMGLMSSYNRLGNMETAASYPLLTEVLRQEWGFKGHIISDMTHSGNSSVNYKCYECINNRILAGCNQQLDSNGFRSDITCKWDNNAFDGKGAPVYTNKDGQTVECYTWWYMLRNNVKESMWTCANCGVMSKTLIKNANLTFVGVERNYLEVAVGEEVNVKVELPEELAGATLSIDPVTPLPQGLVFEDNTIKGKLSEGCNVFIHVLAEKDGTKSGSSLQIFAPKVATTNNMSNSGCFGGIEATFSAIGLLAIASLVTLLVAKKRRVRE